MHRIISISISIVVSLGLFGCVGQITSEDETAPDAGARLSLETQNSGLQKQGADIEFAVPTTTVVLIPGTLITGDYYATMYDRLERDGFRPVIFVPPDLFTESLAVGAQRIKTFIERHVDDTGESKVHVIAECDGGVATRYYLQLLNGHARVDQAITFVSAHHGTTLSPIGAWVAGYQALADITPGSPFMQELNAAPFPGGLKLTSIYSCWDKLLWPQETSRVDGATNVEFCGHYISHFDGFWDALVYEHMLATLRGEGSSLPTYY